MRALFLVLLWIWSANAAAQTMFKCLDDNRRVTYSNVPCDKQGLKDGGAVADRTTTMPLGALPKPAAPAAKDSKDSKASKDDVETIQRGAQIKPVVPLLEKLTK